MANSYPAVKGGGSQAACQLSRWRVAWKGRRGAEHASARSAAERQAVGVGARRGPKAGSEARKGQMHPPPATLPGVCAGTVAGTVSHGDQPHQVGIGATSVFASNLSCDLAPFMTEIKNTFCPASP